MAEAKALTAADVEASLTSAKEARKRVELDAQLLANRIALLKQEEEKAWKKIEETRKRSQEITELREQNANKFAAKEQFYKNKWESIRTAQTKNAQNRDMSKANREITKQGIQEQRSANVREKKQQSHQLLLAKKDREAAERQANQDRGAYVRARKEEGLRRLEEEKLQKMEKYREDYEARTASEELLRSRTDALVANMEKEEMELIQRLQNTQTVQRNAYEELEAALGQTSKPTYTGSAGGGSHRDHRPARTSEPRPAA